MSLSKLQLEYKNSNDNFVKATIQVLWDVGSFERFEIKHEVFGDYITSNASRRQEFGIKR